MTFSSSLNTFQVKQNVEGVFFLKNATGFGKHSFWVRGIPSPLIEYLPTTQGFNAIDGIHTYNNPQKDIYDPISKFTGASYVLVSKNSLERRVEKWLVENFRLKNNADILIEFSFQNIQIIGANHVEFDIMAKTNQAGVKFAASDIYIKYSTEAFGEDVVANEKIEATKGTIIENEVYTLQLADETEQIVKFLVNAGLEPNELYSLSSFFEKFLHVKLDIQNVWQLAQLSFEDFLMGNQSLFYDEASGEFIGFDKIGVSNPVFPFMVPNIINITPNPITAGTNSFLTIIGTGFGEQNNDSKVFFKTADWFPGSTHPEWVEVFTNDDIASWTDEEIIVLVPDFMQNLGSAGTGQVRVENSFGNDISDQTLEVRYNLRNVRFSDENFTNEYRVEIIRQNPVGEEFAITWMISQALSDEDNLVLPITEAAITQWRCETDVSWELNALPTAQNANNATDGINLIYLAPASDFSDPQFIAETFVSGRFGICSAENIIFINEVDIGIKDQDNLFGYALGTDPILLNQKDFFATILHELGHALMLQHAKPLGKVMYPEILPGSTMARTITMDDSDGAKDVIESSQNNLGYNGCPVPINKAPCMIDGTDNNMQPTQNINVYPNPFTQGLTMNFKSKQTGVAVLRLYNFLGQLILEKHVAIVSGENVYHIEENDMQLSKGGYLLQINVGAKTLSSKIIKQ